jgi:putative ABC transport system ATP-binding protein
MSFLYQVENVRFHYQLGGQTLEVLKGITFQVSQSDFLCIQGPSGSGKSTLLNLLGLIEPVQSGNIKFQNLCLNNLAEAKRNEIRKHDLGFIFQSFLLFPVLSAEENVEYFLHRQGLPAHERTQRTQEALTSVGLWEHRKKKPLEMSGGQRQRVAIARALAKRPKVIIADEPTASLDQKTGIEIMDLFSKANQNYGTTLILSSHDLMVHSFCKQTVNLRDGTLTSSQKGSV